MFVSTSMMTQTYIEEKFCLKQNDRMSLHEALSVKVVELEELTEEEVSLRQTLERRVERAFYEAGKALKELRDRRLYKSTHKTFEDYCRDRFGYTRMAAAYKIAAAAVLDNLSTNGLQSADVSTNGLQSASVSTNGLQTSGVSTNGLQSAGVSTNGLQNADVSTNGLQTSGVSTNGLQNADVSTNGLQNADVSTNGLQTSGVSTNGLQILPTNERQVRPLTKLEPEQQQEAWHLAVKSAGGKVPTGRLVEDIVQRIMQRTRVPNPYRVGEVCQFVSKGNPELKGKGGYWCIVGQVNDFSCTVTAWDGEYVVRFDHLKSLNYSDSDCQQMQKICDRITRLRNRDTLENAAYAVLRHLGELKRPYLTPIEEGLLSFLEQEHGH